MHHAHPEVGDSHGRFGHAVIIGAGISGLLAARVLSDFFDHVTIVERDRLDAGTQSRSGVPQARHAHALAARGADILEELFPGIRQELSDAGARVVDFCEHARLCLPYGVPAPVTSGILIQPVSRPLLETTIRQRVQRSPQVEIRDGHVACGLQIDPTGNRVTGITLAPQHTRSRARHSTTLSADLVVDASGRSSHLPDWLVDIGLPRTTETLVDAHVGYASRIYHTDPHTPTHWRALFEPLQAPDTTRGCFALHIENHQLIVTLQGANGDHPSAREDDFTVFLQSLHSDLATTLAMLPASPAIHRHAGTANRRRHYHRLKHWPHGLIALGDAVCTFNPVYAQGMTMAALETLALRSTLSHHHPHRFARRFQRRIARITTWPWTMATYSDHRWHTAQTSLITRIGQWYLTQWRHHIPNNPAMFRDFARVANMLSGPAILFRPHHLARILLTTPASPSNRPTGKPRTPRTRDATTSAESGQVEFPTYGQFQIHRR